MFQLFRVKQLKSVPRTGSYYCMVFLFFFFFFFHLSIPDFFFFFLFVNHLIGTKKDAGNDGGASQAEFLNVLKKMMSTKPNTTPVTDSSKPSSGEFQQLTICLSFLTFRAGLC